MLRQMMEMRARQAIDRALTGRQSEDSFVEFKGEWPQEFRKASRQIAALCNSARSMDVLWVVGVDEKSKTVPGVNSNEMANWWPQVEKCFDGGVAPDITTLSFDWDEGISVAVLHMRTQDAPYVVKTGTEPPLEVPWRSGERTRSAKRSELLQILLPQSSIPRWTVVEATATLFLTESHEAWDASGHAVRPNEWGIRCDAIIFFEVIQPVFIPDMRVGSTVNLSGSQGGVLTLPTSLSATRAHRPDRDIVVTGDGAIRVNESAALSAHSNKRYVNDEIGRSISDSECLEWRIKLGFGMATPAYSVNISLDRRKLHPKEEGGKIAGKWKADIPDIW